MKSLFEERKEIKLRPYQSETVDLTLKHIEEGHKNIIVSAFTSFGKSVVIAELAKRLSKKGKVVILVNITALIEQIAETLDSLGVSFSIVKAGYDFEHQKDVTIMMTQTMFARKDKLDLKADYLLQDEVHVQYNTKMTKDILSYLGVKYRIGFTATPYDSKGYKLEDSVIIDTMPPKRLIEEGYIVPVEYYVPKWALDIDYSKIDIGYGDYAEEALDSIVNTSTFISNAIDSMIEMDIANKKTIIFANSISHCEEVAEALKRKGIKAVAYHSKLSDNESKNIIQSFRDGTIKCLVSVNRISIGFDVPDIELGVMLRKTKVRSKYVQQVGRLHRKAEGKEKAILLDLACNCIEHGFAHEDYQPPAKGHTKALEKEKAKYALDGFKLIAKDKDEPQLIDKKKIELAVAQMKKKSISNMKFEELTHIYEYTTDPVEVIHILYEINKRLKGVHYSKANIKWVSEVWIRAIKDYPGEKRLLLAMLKNRGKKIIKEGKKIASLRFFIDWIKNESNFAYRFESVGVPVVGEIDDEDMPF